MFLGKHGVLVTLLVLFSLTITLVGGLVESMASPALPLSWQTKVDAWVLDPAHTVNGKTEFLVYLTQQADLSRAGSLATKAEKGAYVFKQLTEIARKTQPALLAQ